MEYCIRIAETKDQASILLLMTTHARFEGHELVLSPQHQQLSNLAALPVTIFVVEANNKLYGYMSVVKQFSTWDMDWYLYLDCLYLNEETRGQGVGVQLMQKLKFFAKKNGIKMIQWQTPSDNFTAIEFYQKLNAVNKEKQRFFWSV
ncbi:MAG: GNAT family N-acetyltransferase [Colwellia sp.]|nr:GNAT family N-acetyltransferase [Colwellia sp.]